MLNLQKRRTKIVCTIGPATESKEMIAELIDAGMNIARLNFSHGTHAQHAAVIERLRQVSEEKGVPIGILQDLSGPKIRVEEMASPVVLQPGAEFILFGEKRPGDAAGVSTNFPDLFYAVEPGDTVLLADGSIMLEVVEKRQGNIVCRVQVGGPLDSHKGINLPNRSLPVPSLTAKDKDDLQFGMAHGVDYVALSFVRRPGDIIKIKNMTNRADRAIPVIAKIEKHEALAAIDDIIKVSDGVMVARGDLAVETPLERAPLIQKMIIRKCNQLGRPVITATQMLKSMVEQPRPTRAEATDVANAVFDGTDAVMLSEETTIGRYPVAAVRTMHKILSVTDEALEERAEFGAQVVGGEVSVPSAVSYASVLMAKALEAAAIVTPTQSGSTARMVARFRPKLPIIALSPNPDTVRQLCLVWGIYPYRIDEVASTDEVIERAKRHTVENRFASQGDKLIIIAGVPLGIRGTTNLIKVEEVDL